MRDDEPALWTLTQDYTGPDGARAHAPRRLRARARRGLRPRAHPARTSARTRAPRRTGSAHARDEGEPLPHLQPLRRPDRRDGRGAERRRALRRADRRRRHRQPPGRASRTPRRSRPSRRALAPAELLIADGHHRYETARVYAEEIGGEGEHRYVLMCLVALQDEGLTVFPTHRLIRDTTPQTQEALGTTLRELFTVEEIDRADLRPPDGDGPLTMGYIDSFFKRAFRLTLKDQASADRALRRHARGLPPPRHRRARGARPQRAARPQRGRHRPPQGPRLQPHRRRRRSSSCSPASTTRRSSCARRPIEQVRAIAAAGVNMPPKSTYFFPKVPTGLLFNPLL